MTNSNKTKNDVLHVMEIPVKMEVSHKLKLGKEGLLNLYDANWNLIQTIDILNRMPNLVNGKNKIIFDF